MAIGKPIRPDGHFALLSDQRDRDALENRRSQVSCKHFVIPSTTSPHAHLARSPVGLADQVWLRGGKRDSGKRYSGRKEGRKAGQGTESGTGDEKGGERKGGRGTERGTGTKMGSFGLCFGDATDSEGSSWWNGFSRLESRRGANAVVRESGRLPSIRAGFAGYS